MVSILLLCLVKLSRRDNRKQNATFPGRTIVNKLNMSLNGKGDIWHLLKIIFGRRDDSTFVSDERIYRNSLAFFSTVLEKTFIV